MSSDIHDKKKLKQKLKDSYRISIIDNENLQEVGNYVFSIRRFYVYLLAVAFLISALTIATVSYTPLKRLIPGYGDIEENLKFLELRDKINDLEEELELQMTYTLGLQNMLSGLPVDDVQRSMSDIQSSAEGGKVPQLTEANLKESKMTRSLDNMYLVPPVIGSVSSSYDASIGHLGTDIVAPAKSAIKSISAGVVVGSDFSLDTGNTIIIQHNNNLISVYKHNSVLLKKSGDNISAGEAIAIIGNTGELTDGPHLHLELWYDGTPINPENFINFK